MKDVLLILGFGAVSSLFAWIVVKFHERPGSKTCNDIKHPLKSAQRNTLKETGKSKEGIASSQVTETFELPRKDFSAKDSIDFTITHDADGNRLVSISEDDLDTLKANLLGSHTYESTMEHFDEIKNLEEKRDRLLEDLDKTFDYPTEIREKYKALEVTDKMLITAVKRNFEIEFAGMMGRYCALMDIREFDARKSEREVAILKSEVALFEIIRDYYWKMQSLDLCFDLDDWKLQANNIHLKFYLALEEYLNTWKCQDEFEKAWNAYVDAKEKSEIN